MERTLHRLFLTLFLRGRSARGLHKESAPKSIGSRLLLTLVIYTLMGLMAFVFWGKPVFGLALYLHAMTLVFLGMLVAGSAGEMLFNSQEADILLHRPVTPKALLRAKVGVLAQVSLWLAGAFNLTGFFVGVWCRNGGWGFPLAHALSTVLAALFCAGSVVLVYQLCLRWFGRERLDGVMTTAQVFTAIFAVLGAQLAPQLLGRFSDRAPLSLEAWWVGLLPPAWFAGFDDALAGSGDASSWALGAFGVVVTTGVLWLSFGRLARDYELGLQTLSEAAPARPSPPGSPRRWLNRLAGLPPLCWGLRDPVARASFLLAAAYLVRDREVKLRVFPGLAPLLVFPILLLWQSHGKAGLGSFGIVLGGTYICLIPVLAMQMLRFSQQWQAADLFRLAPLAGPAPLALGARQAVVWLLLAPLLVVYAVAAWFLAPDRSQLLLLLPGLIALPAISLVPCATAAFVPFSAPSEEAKSAGRGLSMFGLMLLSLVLSGLAAAAWSGGWFGWLVFVESGLAIAAYIGLRTRIGQRRWEPLDG